MSANGKADLQISSLKGGKVPKAAAQKIEVSGNLRPIRDTRNPEELL